VNWLRRTEHTESSGAPAPVGTVPGRVERAMPGIATLLEGVSEDRSHAVLDLGPAADSSLQVYSRFARWVRFADLLSATSSPGEWAAALQSIPAQPQRPYDVVFAWNVLDRVAPPERTSVVSRLAELAAPDARLHLIVDPGREGLRYPLRFSLLDVDRICYEQAGRPLPAGEPILPAELERVVEPFRVTRAFTTQVGMREYVALLRRRR
jgi:hypothetical protein